LNNASEEKTPREESGEQEEAVPEEADGTLSRRERRGVRHREPAYWF
jgi:hypothetical protein